MAKKKIVNKKMNKQKGGDNVVDASINVVKAMVDLGKTIFNEIDGLKNFGNELTNVSMITQNK